MGKACPKLRLLVARRRAGRGYTWGGVVVFFFDIVMGYLLFCGNVVVVLLPLVAVFFVDMFMVLV